MTTISEVRSSRERLGRLLDSWDSLVDPRVGVVQDISILPVDDDEPNFFHYLSTSCNTRAFNELDNFGNNGGVSTDPHVAMAKALGEAVERYCSAIFRYDDLTLSTLRDLDVDAVSPKQFALYSEQQYADPSFPWRPLDEDSLIAWTEATSLVSGKEFLVPAAAVFVPYHFRASGGEVPYVQPISTGLAAGAGFVDAALSGACEVIERDAFTITWQAALSRPQIRLDTLPSATRDLVERFERADIEVKLINITTDLGVPSLMAFALSDAATSPALAVAAATAPLAEVAARKCLEELAHTRKYARQLLDYTPPPEVDGDLGYNVIADQRDHLRLYCDAEQVPNAAFAWASDCWVDLGDIEPVGGTGAEEHLECIVAGVADAGLDLLVRDLTTPDISGLDLSVVRAIVPGANPLFMGHATRSLGGRRLATVPGLLGHADAGVSGVDDNPFPHPFP